MKITNIYIQNFSSIEKLDLNPIKLNAFIDAIVQAKVIFSRLLIS
jgi:predicted ATPase